MLMGNWDNSRCRMLHRHIHFGRTMQGFNQQTLDERLRSIAGNLTPEQSERFRQRVRHRAAGGGLNLDGTSLDAAFNLLGALASTRLPNAHLGGTAQRVVRLLDNLNFSSLSAGSLNAQGSDAVTGLAGGLSKLVGGASNMLGRAHMPEGTGAVSHLAAQGGHLLGNAAGLIRRSTGSVPDAGSSAGNLASSAANIASGLSGNAGDALKGLLSLMGKGGSVVDGIGTAASAAGDLAGPLTDLAGNAGDLLGSLGDAADVAGVILDALGDVLGALDF